MKPSLETATSISGSSDERSQYAYAPFTSNLYLLPVNVPEACGLSAAASERGTRAARAIAVARRCIHPPPDWIRGIIAENFTTEAQRTQRFSRCSLCLCGETIQAIFIRGTATQKDIPLHSKSSAPKTPRVVEELHSPDFRWDPRCVVAD